MIRALAVILLLLNCTWLIHWPDRRGSPLTGTFTELGSTCLIADREHIIKLSSDSIELYVGGAPRRGNSITNRWVQLGRGRSGYLVSANLGQGERLQMIIRGNKRGLQVASEQTSSVRGNWVRYGRRGDRGELVNCASLETTSDPN
jgi:hypothetical protein